jgi:predicted SprT family Zn-dependent metalloprotease
MRARELYEVAGQLGELWSLPDLSPTATIEFSDRMTTSLGRCVPSRRLIRLNARLRDGDDELLKEVLCHELAHLAVYVRFGRGAEPHGKEWRRLVSLAGYEPRRRAESVLSDTAARDQVGRDEPPTRRWASSHFEHRCPVCQSVRVARTASPRWRCSECVADGLDGELVITPLPQGDR